MACLGFSLGICFIFSLCKFLILHGIYQVFHSTSYSCSHLENISPPWCSLWKQILKSWERDWLKLSGILDYHWTNQWFDLQDGALRSLHFTSGANWSTASIGAEPCNNMAAALSTVNLCNWDSGEPSQAKENVVVLSRETIC